MLEILQFYVSGFWVWVGITMGVVLMLSPVIKAIRDIISGFRTGFQRGRK